MLHADGQMCSIASHRADGPAPLAERRSRQSHVLLSCQAKELARSSGRTWLAYGHHGQRLGARIANDAAGKPRQMTGKLFNARKTPGPTSAIANNDYAANFVDFLDAAPADRPWCFWYGCQEPHRAYEFQSGVKKGGKQLSDVDRVPEYWPDEETVRHDMLDYALEVEHMDTHLGRMLAELEGRKLLDNTLIIVTSDHGMPFPRVKGYAYHDSNHVPLAIRWPRGMKSTGRNIEDFVDFTDLAPTILDVAGIAHSESGMQPITGKSLREIIESEKNGQVTQWRDHVLVGKERTDVGRPKNQGYPIRGIVTQSHVLLKNYEPSRWPAGNPETGYLDTDGSPTKTLIIDRGRTNRDDKFWRWNFGMRPQLELFDLSSDPGCVRNLADSMSQAERLKQLESRMEEELKSQGDPRMFGQGHLFDEYLPTQGDGFYEKFQRGEKVNAGWVSPSDFEKQPLPVR